MSNKPSANPSKPISKRRYAIYLIVTMLLPFALLGAIELGLRVANPGGGLPLFEKASLVPGDHLVASRSVGQRWFGGISNTPAPPAEPFARIKPEGAFRVFALGESTTAGFPYPRNVTFSRLLRDMLADVLAGPVEVVNLGIAATNSFAMLDMVSEIVAQSPDAVVIYVGHNEYYGALGSASRVNIPGGASVVRTYLMLLRLRTVLAARDAAAGLFGGGNPTETDLEAASLMEILARDREVPLGSARYTAGMRQFETNLDAVVSAFKREGIPVFVGSLVSNLRDLPPFSSEANRGPGGAVAAFDSARAAIARGDTAGGALLFARARDLDVVRFRAPAAFNDVIGRVARSRGAVYVPVAEAFAAGSPGGIPGAGLLLEHVHPNRGGYALIGRAFFDAMVASGVLGSSADASRMRPFSEYLAGTTITPFDERVAHHLVRTLGTRWPFVAVDRQSDYRGSYVPVSLLDSLAFDVSRGAPWEPAKLRLASAYERRKQHDSAAAEYAGLARDAPFFAEPLHLLARSLALAGKAGAADSALRRAVAIRPTPSALATLGASAASRRDLAGAVSFFNRSLALEANQPDVLYRLSLTYGMLNDVPNARASASRLARISPGYPGLGEWMASLGVAP